MIFYRKKDDAKKKWLFFLDKKIKTKDSLE
jgi:hypothetical protein